MRGARGDRREEEKKTMKTNVEWYQETRKEDKEEERMLEAGMLACLKTTSCAAF